MQSITQPVGDSLGGLMARELAREHPDAVRRLITQLTETLDRTRPITVPVTTIYTRRDGVVTWQACPDHASCDVEHVEVGSAHLGLGVDPDVWSLVATRLALPVRTVRGVV